MADLTDEAKAEIAAAVAIVKEDRILKYLRENKTAPTTELPIESSTVDPTEPSVDPNKPTPPPIKPPADPKPKKRGLYWGDNADDE